MIFVVNRKIKKPSDSYQLDIIYLYKTKSGTEFKYRGFSQNG